MKTKKKKKKQISILVKLKKLRLRDKLAAIFVIACLIATSTYQGMKYANRVKVVKPVKHAAIIQLVGGADRVGCTAFVVSDKLAITAGHCVHRTMDDLAKGERNAALMRTEIERLKVTLPQSMSHMFKIKARIKELRQLLRKFAMLEPDMYIIRNNKGQDTGARAIGVKRINHRRDIVILQGNFSNFKRIPIVTRHFALYKDTIYSACGFPDGTLPYACVDYIPKKTHNFLYAGESFFVPGMSGGPVIDQRGRAVGVIVQQYEDMSLVSPLLGVF